MVGDDEEIEVPGVGGHAPRRTAAPRALATSSSRASKRSSPSIRKRIEDTGLLEQLSAGVVLTGGAVLLEGMTEFAEEILGMPVRIGFPTGVKGITQLVHGPQYATGVGLVKYGAQAIAEARSRHEQTQHAPSQTRLRSHVSVTEVEAAPQSSRLWDWIKAAF